MILITCWKILKLIICEHIAISNLILCVIVITIKILSTRSRILDLIICEHFSIFNLNKGWCGEVSQDDEQREPVLSLQLQNIRSSPRWRSTLWAPKLYVEPHCIEECHPEEEDWFDETFSSMFLDVWYRSLGILNLNWKLPLCSGFCSWEIGFAS